MRVSAQLGGSRDADFDAAAVGRGTRLGWDPTAHKPVAVENGIVQLEAEYAGIRPLKTSLGAKITIGTDLLENVGPLGPWTAADVGKVVIWSNNGGTQFDMAKIDSVDGGVAKLVRTAPGGTFYAGFTVTSQRMQWGPDITSAMNAALLDLAADGEHHREARIVGHFLGNIVIPTGVTLRGLGWGKSYPVLNTMSYMDKTGTFIQGMPGANVAVVRLAPNAPDGAGRRWWGPGGLHNLCLMGPHTIVNSNPVTAGAGLSFTDAAGNPVHIQDGNDFSNIAALHAWDSGFEWQAPAVPGWFRGLRAYANGKYGFDYAMGVTDNTQDLSLDRISGDCNGLGLMRIANTNSDAVINVTDVKSEAGDVMVNPRGTSLVADGSYQKDCLIFEECDDTAINVTGGSHIAGSTTGSWGKTHAPGAGIVLKSATTKRPKLSIRGVRTRVLAEQADLSAGPCLLRDEVAGVTIPASVVSAVWPPDAEMADPNLPADRELNMPLETAGISVTLTNSGGVTNNRLGYFTCKQTATRSKLAAAVVTPSSGTAPTLCKLAIYEENQTTGELTLVAATANDPTMFATADTGGANDGIATTEPFTLLAGKRYAIGAICVTTGTAPALRGANVASAASGAVAPRQSAFKASQTDIATPLTGLSNSVFKLFGAAIS